MYRINHLNRFSLITPDEVIFHASTDPDIDQRQILNNIIIGETIVSDAMCFGFYNDFINQKNVIVTADNKDDLLDKINTSLAISDEFENIKKEELPIGAIVNAIELVKDEHYVNLWNMYLGILTAECVDFIAITPSWVRHTNAGQQMNNPKVIGGNDGGSASADLKDIKFKMDASMNSRINPLIAAMHNYICANKGNYPFYCKKCDDCSCGGEAKDKVINRSTNWINPYE